MSDLVWFKKVSLLLEVRWSMQGTASQKKQHGKKYKKA
jgi:hypothetical protein